MSAFSTLLALINAQIKTNGLKAITGAKLNGVLVQMVNELGSGYQFIDIATPATDPGTPDENVWYIASQAGTYTNFGGIIVNENEVCALVWNGSWTKKVTGAATAAQVNQLGQKVEIYNEFDLTDTDVVTDNRRINVSGLSIGDTIATTYNTGSKLMTVPVKANKRVFLKFKGTGYITQYERAWVLTDSDEKIQSWSDETTIDSINNPIVLTPVVDGYIYLSVHPDSVQYGAEVDVVESDSVKEAIDNTIVLLEGEIEDASAELQKKINYYKIFTLSDAISNRRINVSGLSIGDTIATTYNTGSELLVVPVESGKEVSVKFKGTDYNLPYERAWVLTDADEKILSWSDETGFDYTTTPLRLTPSADGYIYLSVHPDSVQYGAEVSVIEYDNVQDALDAKVTEVEQEIGSIRTPNIKILIPDVVFALPGLQVNLWNDCISLSSDKGLDSPMNYKVLWTCSKGLITNRGFRFEPTTDDIGDLACTCKIYTINNDLIDTKNFTIRVLSPNSLSASKRTLFVSDSGGAGTINQVYNNFINSGIFTGTIPQFLGTMGMAPLQYEAVGGYSWASWATAGRTAYRIQVSNIGPLGMGAVYKDANDHYFTVREVNVTAGTGNVLLIENALGYGTLTMPDGTLTKYSGTGDDTISYTDAYQEAANPFWNSNTNKLDFANYRTQHLGLSANEKIDIAVFQLGGNMSTADPSASAELPYIQALYDAFVEDNPSGMFIISSALSHANDLDGAGRNYGASYDYIVQDKRLYDLTVLYNDLLNDTTRPNIRVVAPKFFIDRYYGFPFSTRDVSSRCDVDEKFHSNYFHPTEGGYQQIADELMPGYIGVLTE